MRLQSFLDRVEIRRRNFLGKRDFPYDNKIIFQDFQPLVYDSGDYEPALDMAAKMIDYDTFRRETQPRVAFRQSDFRQAL